MNETLNKLSEGFVQLEPHFLLLNLLVAAAMATLLRWHYMRFSNALANRRDFSRNFLTVALSVVLIISIVKSSLALSLGLVGALSIVRFRTPIKDPEELAYMFLAIALGIGLGANQLIGTTLAFGLILAVLAVRKLVGNERPSTAVYVEVDIPEGEAPGSAVGALSEILEGLSERSKLRRMEARGDAVLVSYAVFCHDDKLLVTMADKIREAWPAATITVLDQQQVPGI